MDGKKVIIPKTKYHNEFHDKDFQIKELKQELVLLQEFNKMLEDRREEVSTDTVLSNMQEHGEKEREQERIILSALTADLWKRVNNSLSLISAFEENYRNLYDNAPDLYRTITLDGILIDCNLSYAKNFGYDKGEIIGKSVFDFTPKEHHNSLRAIFEDWKQNKTILNRELWFVRKNGTHFLGLISVSTFSNHEHKIIGSNTVIKDITAIHEYRKQTAEYNRKINQQLEELQKLNKSKDEFLAQVSHELKTPLVPIKGYADLLLAQKFGSLTEKQRDRIKIIQENTHRMMKMVSDLLDTQKLGLGQLKFSMDTHNIYDILESCIENLNPDFTVKNIQIDVNIDKKISIICDRSRIEQVFLNLLSNSLGFVSKDTGKILISDKTERGSYHISIQDNGQGIPPSQIAKIFDKFFQADVSFTREHSGSGLGLSICKGIIECHKGKIWAESEGIGKGTAMHFTLPLYK